jgi:hypothetical protein
MPSRDTDVDQPDPTDPAESSTSLTETPAASGDEETTDATSTGDGDPPNHWVTI